MKRIYMCLLFLTTNTAIAQYKPIDRGSDIHFKISNIVFEVIGTFSGVQGAILFNPSDLPSARFDVWVPSGSIQSGSDARDKLLKTDEYFSSTKYPSINIVSTKILRANNGLYTFCGQLKIKNRIKSISFPFTVTPSGNNIVFKGAFDIDRRDFGVGADNAVANNLHVYLTVTAKKSDPVFNSDRLAKKN